MAYQVRVVAHGRLDHVWPFWFDTFQIEYAVLAADEGFVAVAWEAIPSLPLQDESGFKASSGVVAFFDNTLRRFWGPIPFTDLRLPAMAWVGSLRLVEFRGPHDLCMAYRDGLDGYKGKFAVFDRVGRPTWGRTGPKLFSDSRLTGVSGRTGPPRSGEVEVFFTDESGAWKVPIDRAGNLGEKERCGIRERPKGIVMGTFSIGESHPIVHYEIGAYLDFPPIRDKFQSESVEGLGWFTACPLTSERFLLAGTTGYAVCDLEGEYVHGPGVYPELSFDHICAIDLPNGDALLAGLKHTSGWGWPDSPILTCMIIDASGNIARGPTTIGEGLFTGIKTIPQALAPLEDGRVLLVAQSGYDLVYYVLQ